MKLSKPRGRPRNPIQKHELSWFDLSLYDADQSLNATGWLRMLLLRRILIAAGPGGGLSGVNSRHKANNLCRVIAQAIYPSFSSSSKENWVHAIQIENSILKYLPPLLRHLLIAPVPETANGTALGDQVKSVIDYEEGRPAEGGHSIAGDMRDLMNIRPITPVIEQYKNDPFGLDIFDFPDFEEELNLPHMVASAVRVEFGGDENTTDPRSDAFNSFYATASVDLTRSDKDIFSDFKEWLMEKRRSRGLMGSEDTKLNAGGELASKKFHSWSENRVLALLDLYLIAQYSGRPIVDKTIGKAVFGHLKGDLPGKVQKVMKQIVKPLMTSSLEVLQAETGVFITHNYEI